jgi:hypothetical protein
MTEIHPKLKKLIAKYLLRDLHRVEIIYYRDSIWFIDRENRYWYFEYHKVDKHLWWRWSHFTQALKMFSMDGEKEQSIFGELVNMILTKKQNLESKYPNKIFKTVGSVINFKDNVEAVLKNEVKTTGYRPIFEFQKVDEVLNNEVETTDGYGWKPRAVVDEVLNYEVKTTKRAVMDYIDEVDEALNNEVETTSNAFEIPESLVDEVLNCEVETTQSALAHYGAMVDDVLNYEVEKTEGVFYNDEIVTQEVLDFSIETTKSGELIEEDKIMDDVLEIQNIQPTERGVNDMVDFVLDVEDYQAWNGKQETKVNEVLESAIEIEKIGHLKTHRLRPVTGALDYNVDSMDSVIGGLKNEVKKVLDSTVEINSIEKLKGENPFQDIIVGHILDESDKVTDKLKMKEDDYVKTYSHDVYMCDHLVQNVLDVGVNSIHYDAEPHTQLIDGILKKT